MTNPIIDFSKIVPPQRQSDGDSILDFNKVITEPAETQPQEDYFMRYKRITQEERNKVYNKFINAVMPGADAAFTRGMLDTIPRGILNVASLLTNPRHGGGALGGAVRSLGQMGSDLVPNWFGEATFYDEIKKSGKAMVDLPIGLVAGLAAPIKAIAEVTIGAQLALDSENKDFFRESWEIVRGAPLTEEEREERGRIVAANVIGLAVGIGAHRAITSKMAGIKPIAGETLYKHLSKQESMPMIQGVLTNSDLAVGQLIDILRAPKGTTFMRNAAANAGSGVAGGATLGFLEGDTPDEAAQAAAAFGLIALPLGLAFTSVGKAYTGVRGRPYMDKAEMIAREAGALAKMRQITMMQENTPIEILSNMENAHATKSLAATAAAQAIRYEKLGFDRDGNAIEFGTGARIVPQVPVEEAPSILNVISTISKQDGIGRKTTLHKRPDQMLDVLVTPIDADARVLANFEKYGLLDGQQVSYGGNRYYMIEGFGEAKPSAPQVPTGTAQTRVAMEPRPLELLTDAELKQLSDDYSARLVHLRNASTTGNYQRAHNDYAVIQRMIAARANAPAAAPTTNYTGPTAKLRDLVSNDRIEVPLTDVMRPTNQHLTELAFFQRRLVSRDDIFDFGFGFTEGRNFVYRNSGLGNNRDDRISSVSAQVNSDLHHEWGVMLRTSSDGTERVGVFDKVYTSNNPTLIQELKPGLNEIVNGDKTVAVYMGGEEVMVNGQKVMVGNPNDPVVIFSWRKRPHINPQVGMVNVSHDLWSDPNAPNRHLATQAMLDYRGQKGIAQSESTLSPGSADFLSRTLNKYPDLIPKLRKELGVVDIETLARVTFQDFLDFIRFEDRPTPLGSQPGRPRTDPTITPGLTGYNLAGTDSRIGQRGTTVRDVAQAQPGGRSELYEYARRYYVEKDQGNANAVGMEEKNFARLLENESVGGVTPAPSGPPQFAPGAQLISRDGMTFNDMFAEWIKVRGVSEQTAPLLRQHFEKAVGDFLLGEGQAIKQLTDVATVPMLKHRIAQLDRDIAKFNRDYPDAQAVADHISQGGDIKIEGETFYAFQAALQKIDDMTFIRRTFQNRVDMLEKMEGPALSPRELELAKKLQADILATRKEMANHVVHVASETGHYIQREHGGRIEIFDALTHEKMAKFNSPEDAVAWMKKSAQAEGKNIDGGAENNIVPPSQLGSHLMGGPPPLDPPHAVPFNFKPPGRMERFFDVINSIPYITVKRSFMIAMDNQFGSRLFSDVYAPMQTAALRRDLASRSYLERLQKIEDKLTKAKISREEWGLISDYRESISPDEIKRRLFRHRPLTQQEVGFADEIMALGVDIGKVQEFKKLRSELAADIKKRAERIDRMAPDAQAKMTALQEELLQKNELIQNKLLITSKEFQALDVLNRIEQMDPDDARLDAVVRLARAQEGTEKAFSRQEFIASNKMRPELIEAAHEIDKIFADLMGDLQVDESILYYLGQYKVEKTLPNQMAVGRNPLAKNDKATRDLATRIIESGETAIFERDPITQMLGLIRAGMNDKHFTATWEAAFKRSAEVLKEMPADVRPKAAKVVGEYLFDMKGYKAESDVFAQAVINNYLDMAKIDADVNLRRDIVHTMLAANSGSFIGFRPAQGVRDLNTFFKIYVTRFGLDRYRNGLHLAFKRDSEGRLPIERLAEEGKIPTLSPIMFQTAEELANEMAGKRGRRVVQKAISKFADVGFAATGQPNIYGMSHAIAYLDMQSTAQPWITKLMRNEVTKAEAYEKIGLDTFYRPVAERFDELIVQGKDKAAVEFLAQQAGIETAFVFGLHNQPYLWGTSLGRLIGHYGQWPMWDRNFLQQVATRGTPRQRAAAIKRYAITEGITYTMGKAVGMNMRSWSLIPGAVFLGGPAVDMANQLYDMSGARGERRQDLALAMYGPRLPIISNFVPGSGVFNDYFQAYKMMNKDFNPASSILRGLGFSINQRHESVLDQVLGYSPEGVEK